MKHRRVTLGSVCHQERLTVKPGERDDLRYIGLESIEAGTGSLVQGELSKTPDAPQANSFRFGPQHVLYGKLRPYLNKVLVPTFEGKCSTEIAPLLPSADLDRQYLAFFLRSAQTVARISGKTSGARMPRADMDFVLGMELPLPPLAEQRRIVDLLSRAESILRLRREAQAKAQAIIPALFLDMFGDPATNPKGWPVRPVGELLSIPIRNGVSPSRTGSHRGRVLTLSAITGGMFDSTKVKAAMFAAPLVEADEVCAQDFLVCRGNGNKSLVGVGCFPDRDLRGVVFPDTAIAVRPVFALLSPHFLAAQWCSPWVRQQIEAVAKTTNGTYKINQTGLARVRLLVPDHESQQTFHQRVQAIKTIVSQQAEALPKAEAVIQSLLARAFSGEGQG